MERRAQQSQQSVSAEADDDTADDSAPTPEQLRQAEEALAIVNVDEMVDDLQEVAIRERSPHKITIPDEESETGQREVVTYLYTTRTVAIPKDPFGDAYALAATARDHRKEGTAALIKLMTACVLLQWQHVEPWMTAKRLEEGLGAIRIQKLFTLFFTPTLTQKKSPVS